MAKRKWTRFLELFRLSRLRRRAPTGLAPNGLQSGLGPTWGGSATQAEADAAAAKYAAFTESLKGLRWEDFTPVFGACFVHDRWWRGEGSCPFCEEMSHGKA